MSALGTFSKLAAAGTLGLTTAIVIHPDSPAPQVAEKVVEEVGDFISGPEEDPFVPDSYYENRTIEDSCPDVEISSRPSKAPSHFIIQLGERYFAIPSNAIPSNAIPSNYIPSNFKPNNAIPAEAIPSNVIRVIIENYAIPSNFMPENALENSSVTFLSDTQEIIDLLEITKSAIPAEALPASLAPDVRREFALPASDLPGSAQELMGDLAIPSNALPASAIPSNVMAMQTALPASLGVIEQVNALPASALPASALPASALPASARIEVKAFSADDSILCQNPYENLSTKICTAGGGITVCQPSQLDNSGNRIMNGSIIFDEDYAGGVEFGTASSDACDEQFTSLAIYPGRDQSQGQLSIFVDSADAFDSGAYQLVLDPPGESYSCQFVRVNSDLTDATRLICTGPQVNVTASRASLYPAGKNCEIAVTAINLPGTVQQVDNPPGAELAGPPDDDDGSGAELAGPDEEDSSASSSGGSEETGLGGDSSSGSEGSGDDAGTEYGGPACGSAPPPPDPSDSLSYTVYDEWCSCMGGELQFPSGGSEAPPSCDLP